MVTSIARQSVIIKCNMQSSIMLGNYEFYYGAGFFLKLENIPCEKGLKPLELKEFLKPHLDAYNGEDKRENYLVKILLTCKVSEEYDNQMEELFLMGQNEAYPWEVTIPV